MNEHEQKLPEGARVGLKKLFAEIRFARATELAQSGRFLEAEGLLNPNGELPDNPAELDLLARIAGQRGQFDKARRYWTVARQRGLNNASYESGIGGIQQVQDAASNRRKISAISLATAAVVTGVAIAVIFWPSKQLPLPKAPSPQVQPALTQLQKPEPSVPPPIIFKITQPTTTPAER